MNKKNRIIILLLLFIYLLNFTIQPKVNAEAIAISSGLVLFLKACYAAGITYLGGQAVSKVTEDSIELYREWQKFLDRQPPQNKPPTDWEKTVVGTMLGLQLGDSFKRLVDSVKDFFNDLGAKEGDNNTSNRTDIIIITNRFLFQNDSSISDSPSLKDSKLKIGFLINGQYFGITSSQYNMNYGWSNLNTSFSFNYDDILKEVIVSYSYSVDKKGYGVVSDSGTRTIPYKDIPGYSDSYIPEDYKVINYYYDNGTYQFTNNPDDIRPVYPNIANLPDGKTVKVTNPDGSTTTYYKGTFDDLFNDWIATQDPNNLFGDTPLNLTETEQGIKIDDNSDEMPYPNPEPQPEPDTGKGLGEIIALLKQILNWNKNIHDKIGQTPEEKPTPEPEPQPDPMELPEKVELDFSPLQGLGITERFPFCLPWDLKRSIEKLISPGEPPLWEFEILKNKIVIDFSQFESLASISRGFFSIIFTISLVVITRRFISGA